MNSNSIKLNGKFEIPEALEIDQSYELKLTAGITAISKHSQEDGSYEFVYAAKPEFGEVVKDNGQVLKLRKKGSQSQKLRAEILSMGLDYEATMSKLIDRLEEVLEVIK